jgi:hypothetical protein
MYKCLELSFKIGIFLCKYKGTVRDTETQMQKVEQVFGVSQSLDSFHVFIPQRKQFQFLREILDTGSSLESPEELFKNPHV